MSCFNSERREREREQKLEQERKNMIINDQLRKDKDVYKSTHRLLLLGLSKSGKSTIVKQMKIFHKDGYSDIERFEKVLDIRSNIKEIITTVIKVMPKLDPPLRIIDPNNKIHEEYILNIVDKTHNFEYSPEFFKIVEHLWEDEGVKEAYERSNEYQLLESAEYFMVPDKLQEVARSDFKPSNQDILHCQVMTSGISETKIVVERVHFHVVDVCNQCIERRRKWVQCFNDVTAILFVIDCSSFNTVVREDEKILRQTGEKVFTPTVLSSNTRLHESLDLFESVWNDRWLKSVSIILFLNKQDKLKKKLEEGKKLEEYFPDFASYSAPDNTTGEPGDSLLYTSAKYFIRDQFMKLSMKTHDGRHFCYPHFTNTIDTENIRRVFESCKDITQRMCNLKYELQ